jgi:type IV pilus assembly protein PilV
MQRKNDLGFTLLEILIAISVLAIALLAMAQMQVVAIKGNSFASRMTTATTLAQDKMEQLKRLPYNDPSNLIDDNVTDDDLSNTGDVGDADAAYYHDSNNPIEGIYTRVWNVSDNDTISYKTVSVIVGWDNWGHQVRLETIIAQ